MRKKITRLVCVCMASCCVLMAAGQEKKTTVRITEERTIPQKEIKLRVDGKEQPDSVVCYDDRGNRTYVYYNLLEGPRCYYNEDDNYWYFPFIHIGGGYGYPAKRISDVKYNSDGLIESLVDNNGYYSTFMRFQYNTNGYLLSYEEHIPLQGNLLGEYNYKTIYSYDTYDNWVGSQRYSVEDGEMIPVGYTYSARVDSKGRIVYSELNYGDGGLLIGEQLSYFESFIWYYSDATNTPNAEVENNAPIGGDNQGSFDLNVNVPTDSISSGSVTVTFPEGFTLDEETTSLTLDFVADFTLTITKQENNSWLLEIKPKELRSAPLRADEVEKAIQVAYLVDEEVKRGNYDISVNSIMFETPYGNIISEPAITVPADLNRWGVANEGIEDANVAVYVTGNTLYIETILSETITVYAINGSKLYEATVSSGTVTVDASAFPQGVLIVKGSSGWVKKIVV